MKKTFCFIALLVIAGLALSCGVQAQVSMWFTDASGNSIDQIFVKPGDLFTIQVWMSTTVLSRGFALALGYDQSTSMGISASCLDGKLALATDNVASDVIWGMEIVNTYKDNLAFTKAGLRAPVGAAYGSLRPYGLHLARNNVAYIPILSGLPIATINMRNNMISGEQYTMSIWDAGSGSSYTSVLNVGQVGYYPRTSDILTVKSLVPEPSSLFALGGGLMGLGAFLRRRK